MKIGNIEVTENGNVITWTSHLTVDADGAPNAYAPHGKGITTLDDLTNAGHPGNWYGVVTHNGKANGNPVIQSKTDPCPGAYISPTALRDHSKALTDPRAYVDATKIPYIAVPPEILHLGVKKGDVALVSNIHKGYDCAAIVADVGPHNKIGEGSVALAIALGLSGNARNGGTDALIIAVKLFRGTSRGWPRTNEDIQTQVNEVLSSTLTA